MDITSSGFCQTAFNLCRLQGGKGNAAFQMFGCFASNRYYRNQISAARFLLENAKFSVFLKSLRHIKKNLLKLLDYLELYFK